jgi:hypothetical protein
MISKFATLFSTFVVTLSFFLTLPGPSSVNGSLNGSIDITNATLPEMDANYESGDKERNTQTCQMPPCPPGEMCIQVCPEPAP